MISYYYALWIPQFKEGIPDVKNQKLDEVDLKDKPNDPPLLVSGEVCRDTLRISLRYKLGDNPYKSLVFHKISATETGFLVYKLNLDDNETDFLCEELRHTMPKAIYHYVKNFFHEHQFHNSDDDSLLDSFFSSEEIQIQNEGTMRNILKVYLQSYINKYAGCVFLCRDSLHTIAYNKQQNIKLGDSLIELRRIMNNNTTVLDGESLYCDFMINSYPGLVDSVQLQRIYGLRNELARYDERLQRTESSILSKESRMLGRLGLWASIGGAVLGAALSYWFSLNSSTELRDGVNSIRHEIMQNKSEDLQIRRKLHFLGEQQDSILKLMNKPTPKK